MGHWSGNKFQLNRNLAPCLSSDKPHDTGHENPGPPSLSDTCPNLCLNINQNVNGIGKNSNDKLEKQIESMIEQKIHGYCLQET